MTSIHEECGVFGIYAAQDAKLFPAEETFNALYALQHRGQDNCGIAVSDRGVIRVRKNVGLVSDVFDDESVKDLKGQIAIGHCRYAANDVRDREHALPIVIEHAKGNLAVAQNGAVVNARELRRKLELDGAVFQTKGDGELIANLIARERLKCGSIEQALLNLLDIMTGAYSMVVMSPRKLLAVRDRNGYRPLCIGQIGDSYVFASESVAMDATGAKFLRDVDPGEVVWVDSDGLHSMKAPDNGTRQSLCVFEYVYFARPDSVIDGMSVDLFRQKAGMYLALESPVGADVVIGVPDSGLPAAIGFAHASGIPYGVGLIKNRYIGRTFIQPTQGQRERSVQIKLNALSQTVRGKRVVMIDDSIVRGTTSAHLVAMLREAGATEVHMRISCPPFLYPCHFGTDVPDRSMLLAVGRSVEDMRKIIGVDSLAFLSLGALHKIAQEVHIGVCDACFTGEYATEIPEPDGPDKYEQHIEDEK